MTSTGADRREAELVAEEARRVVRCFQRYSSQQRADHAASHRLGHRQRQATGEFFYVHPAIPARAFRTRRAAARAAVALLGTAERGAGSLPVTSGYATADPFAVFANAGELAKVEEAFPL